MRTIDTFEDTVYVYRHSLGAIPVYSVVHHIMDYSGIHNSYHKYYIKNNLVERQRNILYECQILFTAFGILRMEA